MVRLILHRALYLWQGKGGPIHKIPQGMRWLPVGHSLMQQLRHQVKGFRIPATPEHYMFADIRTGQQFSFVVIALLLKQPLQFRIAGRFILVYVVHHNFLYLFFIHVVLPSVAISQWIIRGYCVYICNTYTPHSFLSWFSSFISSDVSFPSSV